MGTELMRACIKDENDEFPSVPPGFESITSFTLTRLQDSEKQEMESMVSCSASTNASESNSVQMETEVDFSDTAKAKRCLRRRRSINYGRYDNSSGDDSDAERPGQVNFLLVITNNYVFLAALNYYFFSQSAILVHYLHVIYCCRIFLQGLVFPRGLSVDVQSVVTAKRLFRIIM
jgi:hypothetical protein